MAKILLVDDDPDFVDATKLILEKSGHQIVCCHHREKAEKRYGRHKSSRIVHNPDRACCRF